MTAQTKEIVLAKLDFEGFPEGTILRGWKPSEGIEEQYFGGWRNALWGNGNSWWAITIDGGKPVLDHPVYIDQCLTTGDPLWQDYTVEAGVRQMLPNSLPVLWMDHEYSTKGRIGIMFRYQTSRHHYFYGIECYNKLILCRREDRNWIVLDELQRPFDRERYYNLKVEVEGYRIRCFLDGEKKLEAEDKAFPSGKVGIRSNCRSRFSRVKVTTTQERQTAFVSRKERYDAEAAELSTKYPKPVLWKKVDISGHTPCSFTFANLRGTAQKDILLWQSDMSNTAHVMALDLQGNVLWRTPGLCNLPKVCDMNGDGCDEIACILDGKLTILSGVTGEVIVQASNTPATSFDSLYVCNLRGTPQAQDIFVRAMEPIWVYDEQLNLRWKRSSRHGHEISFYDIDGDGREEIMACFTMTDGEGKVIWELEDSEYIWTHGDAVAVGDFNGDGAPEVATTVGGEGFIMADARTGKVLRRHTIGHAQWLWIGKFRPDLPGLELWVGNRWGSYGILTLFSGSGEKLHIFEPDNLMPPGGPPVNWSGDGEELMCLNYNNEIAGLYNAQGRKVVSFPESGHVFAWGRVEDIVGDARDEIVFTDDKAIYIYTQDRPFPKGEKIYAPIRMPRRGSAISYPNWGICL